MVAIAQLVERQIVALEVMGSIPTSHPLFIDRSANLLPGTGKKTRGKEVVIIEYYEPE